MAAFPTTVATDSDLYIAVNATSTQLTDNPLSNSATTVNVTDATVFPTVGFISIDNEIIKYTGKTGTSFTGCTRGADGTSAVSHVQNSQVFHNVIAAHHNALKDDLIATQQFISDLIGRTSTQVKAPDGTISLPGYSFAADTDTGIYRQAANTIALIVGGANLITGDSTGINFYASGTEIVDVRTAGLRVVDGTSSLPSYSFLLDTDTGIYRSASNTMNLITGATNAMEITTSYVEIGTSHVIRTASDGTAAAPIYTFSSDTDTGLYRSGANDIGVTLGGTQRLSFNTNGLSVTSGHIENQDGTVSTPAYTFVSDPDTGMYRDAANSVSLATNGVRRFTVDTGSISALLAIAMGTNKITGLGNATAAQDASAYTQVKIIQVAYNSSTTPTSTTSTSFVDTNLSVSITPKTTSSTILIFAFGNLSHSASGFSGVATIANGSTSLQGTNGQADVNITATGFGGAVCPASLMVQDSPASTSAQTYKVRIKTVSGSGTTGWGNGNAVYTSIVAVEVNGL